MSPIVVLIISKLPNNGSHHPNTDAPTSNPRFQNGSQRQQPPTLTTPGSKMDHSANNPWPSTLGSHLKKRENCFFIFFSLSLSLCILMFKKEKLKFSFSCFKYNLFVLNYIQCGWSIHDSLYSIMQFRVGSWKYMLLWCFWKHLTLFNIYTLYMCLCVNYANVEFVVSEFSSFAYEWYHNLLAFIFSFTF